MSLATLCVELTSDECEIELQSKTTLVVELAVAECEAEDEGSEGCGCS